MRFVGMSWQFLRAADVHRREFVRPNVRAKATAQEDADWPRKDDTHRAWSGQAVAAVAGRRLERGVSLQCATALTNKYMRTKRLGLPRRLRAL